MSHYYEVTVVQELVIDDGKKSKIKRIKDYLLIQGDSITYIEKRVSELYNDNPNEYEIISVKLSKISEVIDEGDDIM